MRCDEGEGGVVVLVGVSGVGNGGYGDVGREGLRRRGGRSGRRGFLRFAWLIERGAVWRWERLGVGYWSPMPDSEGDEDLPRATSAEPNLNAMALLLQQECIILRCRETSREDLLYGGYG